MIATFEVNGRKIPVVTEKEEEAMQVMMFKKRAEHPIEEYIVDVAHALAKEFIEEFLVVGVFLFCEEEITHCIELIQLDYWFNSISLYESANDSKPFLKYETRTACNNVLIANLSSSPVYSTMFRASFIEQFEECFGKSVVEAEDKWPARLWKNNYKFTFKC